jgi:hypothetical protein
MHRHFPAVLAGLPMQTEVGAQSRCDDIRHDLNNSLWRAFLSPIGGIALMSCSSS